MKEALLSMQRHLLQIVFLPSSKASTDDPIPATYRVGNSDIVVFFFKIQIINAIIFVSAIKGKEAYKDYLLIWNLIIKQVAEILEKPEMQESKSDIKVHFDSLPQEYKYLYKKYNGIAEQKIKKQVDDENQFELIINMQKVIFFQARSQKKLLSRINIPRLINKK